MIWLNSTTLMLTDVSRAGCQAYNLDNIRCQPTPTGLNVTLKTVFCGPTPFASIYIILLFSCVLSAALMCHISGILLSIVLT